MAKVFLRYWKCPKCGEQIEAKDEVCWNCGTGKDGTPPSTQQVFEKEKAEKHQQEMTKVGGNMNNKQFEFKDIFFFESMLTPKIITFIYWLQLLGVAIYGFILIFQNQILLGLGIIIGGLLVARISCELLIVIFKIHENLKKIVDKS